MKPEGYVPEQCVWELTRQCNMHCVHCGSNAGTALHDELTLDECLDVAGQLIDLGNLKTTFIGGEIFLYPGWERIARRMSDNGVTVNIITNGFMFGDRQVDQIKEAGLVNVAISLDGMRENHDKTRNVDSAFQKVLRAFARLKEEHIPIAVITSLMDVNVSDLEPMYHLLVEHRVNAWQLQIATPMGNMRERKNMLLNPAHVPMITEFIRRKRSEGRLSVFAGDNIGYYDRNEAYLRTPPGTIGAWSGCQAGLTAVGIDSAGNVRGCESLNDDGFIEGNLQRETLRDIWTKKGNFKYNRRFDPSQLSGQCAGCPKAEICRGGCRGACYFNSLRMFENPYCDYRTTMES
jgi:radical SAM protein with 4Fe4S-binding SPASM domain